MRLQRRHFDNRFFRYIQVRDFLWSPRLNPSKSNAQTMIGSLPFECQKQKFRFINLRIFEKFNVCEDSTYEII